VEIYLHNKFR